MSISQTEHKIEHLLEHVLNEMPICLIGKASCSIRTIEDFENKKSKKILHAGISMPDMQTFINESQVDDGVVAIVAKTMDNKTQLKFMQNNAIKDILDLPGMIEIDKNGNCKCYLYDKGEPSSSYETTLDDILHNLNHKEEETCNSIMKC
jgi:hypothetical protein